MTALIMALLEHPEQHSSVRRCLEAAGHEIVVVNSFPRAKEILNDHAFDLIISEVHLENGGSIFDFLKWAKSKPTLKSIPFVLLSLQPTALAKYLSDGVRSSARMFGAAKYISMETFDGATFAREITELLPASARYAPLKDSKEGNRNGS